MMRKKIELGLYSVFWDSFEFFFLAHCLRMWLFGGGKGGDCHAYLIFHW